MEKKLAIKTKELEINATVYEQRMDKNSNFKLLFIGYIIYS